MARRPRLAPSRALRAGLAAGSFTLAGAGALAATVLGGAGGVASAAASTAPPAGVHVTVIDEEAAHTLPGQARVASTRSASHTTSYAFENVTGSSPTRWNPSLPIYWVFNPAHAPAGALGWVQADLNEVSARTGLTFRYQGTSGAVPTKNYPLQMTNGSWRPVLIGWEPQSGSDLLSGQAANVAGVTEPVMANDGGPTQIVAADIVFNASQHLSASTWKNGILKHEFGHLVGLAHTSDGTQEMYAVYSGQTVDYGTGDVSGLARLGTRAGTMTPVQGSRR